MIKKQIKYSFLVLTALFSLALPSLATDRDNPCKEDVPYKYTCTKEGTITCDEEIDEEITICKNGTFSFPTINTTLTDGEKKGTRVPKCSASESSTEEYVTYTEKTWWVDEEGKTVTESDVDVTKCGTFEFTAKAKGVAADTCYDTDDVDCGTLTLNILEASISVVYDYINYNEDDDNNDKKMDYETEPVTGEDDLVEASLTVCPVISGGTVTLTPTSRLKVWLDKEKKKVSPNTWAVADLPAVVYVEGISPSEKEKDSSLTLTYTADGESCSSPQLITVVSVDLECQDLDEDGKGDEPFLPEQHETVPGAYVPWNDDDDDGSKTWDLKEDPDDNLPMTWTSQSPLQEDDDLEKIEIKIYPPDGTGAVELEVPEGMEVWLDRKKDEKKSKCPRSWDSPAEVPEEIYVECLTEDATGEVKLTYTSPAKDPSEDAIKVTAINPDLTMATAKGIDGEEEDIENVPDAPHENSMELLIAKSFTDYPDLNELALTGVNEIKRGTVTLDATNSSEITVWEDEERTKEVTLPKTWQCETNGPDVPSVLYVEGIKASSSAAAGDGVSLALSYEPESGVSLCEDTLHITVVEVTSIEVIREGSDESLSSSTTIAAGGIDSDVHKAEVTVVVEPVPFSVDWSVKVCLKLEGADGEDLDGTLVFDDNGDDDITGDETKYVVIENGLSASDAITAIYESSDKIQDVTISSPSSSKTSDTTITVTQDWDNDGAYDYDYPAFFMPGVADYVKFFPTINEIGNGDDSADGPIDGHSMAWYTARIEIEWWEINWETFDYREGTKIFENPNAENIDIKYGKRINDLVKHTVGTEPNDGVYKNEQTVSDFFENSEAQTREILVISYDFGAYDKSVFNSGK